MISTTQYPIIHLKVLQYLRSTTLNIILISLALLLTASLGIVYSAPGDEFPTGAVFMPSDLQQLSQLDHYRFMKQFGFNQVEPEFMFLENGLARWRFFEPHEGVINWLPLDHWIDDARKAGVRVYIDISVFGFDPIPKWVWDKYPDMGVMTPNGPVDQLVPANTTPSMAHPGYRQEAREFLTAVAARYKDDPTVAGIIIGNERGLSNSSQHNYENYYGLDYNNAVKNGFHQFLQQKYGTIANLNSKWGKSYASFNDINWTGEWITNTAAYRGEWLEYNLYRHKYVADFHRELHDGIKSVAPNMPTIGVSLGNFYSVRLAHGGDAASLSFLDYIGDKHYYWDNDNTNEEKLVEFLSTITGKPYLIVNQGTRTQMFDLPMTPAETHQMIRQAWQGIGRGARGLLYWLWTEPNNDQLQYHSVLKYDSSSKPVPMDHLYPIGQSMRFIRRFDKVLLGSTQNVDKQIAMLDADLTYIQDEPLYMSRDATKVSFPSPGPHCEEWMAVSTALVYNNYPLTHLSDQMVRGNALDQSKVLVLAGNKYLYADVAAKIEQWLSVAGHYLVITSGSGLYDELGRTSGWQQRMINLYGSRVKLLTDNYVNPSMEDLIAKSEVQSLFSFLNLRVTRKYDLENISDRGKVSVGMLRYQDPDTGKRTDLVVLTNRLAMGTDVNNFKLRLAEDFQYAAAYSFDPWHDPNKKPLTISRSGAYTRVNIDTLKDVLVLVFTEDPSEADGDKDSPSRPFLDLSKKASWWDSRWTCRVPVQFYSAEHNGQDLILKCSLDTQSMPELAQIDPSSARVFEMDRDWNMIGERERTVQVPQPGKIDVFLKMTGRTGEYACRNFYVYFGPAGLPAGPSLPLPQDSTIRLQTEDTTSRDYGFRLKRQADGFGGKSLALDRGTISISGYSLNYQFKVAQAGNYRMHIRHIGGFYSGEHDLQLTNLRVDVDGSNRRSGAMSYDRIWQFESVDIGSLSVGSHTLKLLINKADQDFTIDYITIVPTGYAPASPAVVDWTWAGSPESATILRDSFVTTVTNSDINYQNELGRQQGTFKPFFWTERPETAPNGANNSLTVVRHPYGGESLGLFCTGMSFGGDITKYIWTAPMHNFVDNGKQTIRVNIDPYGGGSQPGDNWAAVIFGTNLPGTYVIPGISVSGTPTSTGMSLVLTTSGGWTVYDGSAQLATGTVPAHEGFYDVKIDVDTASFDGRPANISFSIDNISVYDCSRPYGFYNNFITLSGLGLGTTGYQTHFFDNFSVTLPAFVTETPYEGSVSGAKQLADGKPVSFHNKVLYLNCGSFGYIEEPDRTSGIRLEGNISTGEGRSINVTGKMATTVHGERYIQVDQLLDLGALSVEPFGVANSSGISSYLLDGLYVRVWGMVQPGSITASSFVVNDGGEEVLVLTEVAPGVSEGQFVIIDGAAGLAGGRVIHMLKQTMPQPLSL